MAQSLETHLLFVQQNGLKTSKAVDFSGASSVALPSAPTAGGNIVPTLEYVVSPTFAAAGFVNGTAYPIYTFPNDGQTYKLVFASLRATTAGGASSTCTIYIDPSGTAPGAGTAQFAAMALDGTANTVVNATTPVNTASIAGAAISLKAGGAATTGLVGLVVTIAMQRLT